MNKRKAENYEDCEFCPRLAEIVIEDKDGVYGRELRLCKKHVRKFRDVL